MEVISKVTSSLALVSGSKLKLADTGRAISTLQGMLQQSIIRRENKHIISSRHPLWCCCFITLSDAYLNINNWNSLVVKESYSSSTAAASTFHICYYCLEAHREWALPGVLTANEQACEQLYKLKFTQLKSVKSIGSIYLDSLF